MSIFVKIHYERANNKNSLSYEIFKGTWNGTQIQNTKYKLCFVFHSPTRFRVT